MDFSLISYSASSCIAFKCTSKSISLAVLLWASNGVYHVGYWVLVCQPQWSMHACIVVYGMYDTHLGSINELEMGDGIICSRVDINPNLQLWIRGMKTRRLYLS